MAFSRLQFGEMISGHYVLRHLLKQDAAYQYWEAEDIQENTSVILQVLTLSTSSALLSALHDYFDELHFLRRRELYRPDSLFSDASYPLILCYSTQPETTLETVLREFPARRQELLLQAAETLHILHNRGLAHGSLNPDCFGYREDYVVLGGFGYAPLIAQGSEEIVRTQRLFTAPEVLQTYQTSIAADIFAFAQIAAQWMPEIKSTEFYRQATEVEPGRRFQRLRSAIKILKEEWRGTAPNNGGTMIAPMVEEVSNVPQASILIPRLSVQVGAESSDCGTVSGGGDYLLDDTVTLEAKANPRWQFDCWIGDVYEKSNPYTFTIVENLEISARFVRADKVALNLLCEPPDAGGIWGNKRHEQGSLTQIRAVPTNREWEFDYWSGDSLSGRNPLLLSMERGKTVTAHFVLRGIATMNVQIDPPEAGQMTSQRQFPRGRLVQVRVVPASPQWKFSHWSGDMQGNRNAQVVRLPRSLFAVAHFVRIGETN